MKLFKALLLIMLCIFGLTACGSQDQKNPGSGEEDAKAAEEITAATFVSEDIESEAATESESSAEGGISFDVSAPEISFKIKPYFGIGMEDTGLTVLGNTLNAMEKAGLAADQDLTTTVLKSQEIKKDIVLHYKDAALTVAAVNPYENEAPLGDCVIVGASSEDTTGIFTMDSSDHMCGKATYDEMTFDGVYEKTDNKLVYKTFSLRPMVMSFDLGSEDPKGEQILEVNGDTDLILDFENGIMHRFTYLLPDLYYGGMQDNIISGTIGSVDDTAIEAAKIIRDDILAELKTAFTSAGIDVDINDTTGEIVMGNDVLFGLDSYDLSDEGKEYIDRFMGAYASVIFGDKYSDSIAEVSFEGHTDSSGEEEHNQTLSENRAKAIMNYCLESEKNGMTPEQKEQLKKVAKSVGYASSDLVYDDKGNEIPEKSRRAAIKFFVNVK